MKRVYFKSFKRTDPKAQLESSILDTRNNSLIRCQTLEEVLEKKLIKANTIHHNLPMRLSVSCPTEGFRGEYRPEGVLFTTKQEPAYCVPFDLMALTEGKKFNHEDYGSDFLRGYEKFVFKDFDSMISHFPNSDEAIASLNDFRRSHNLPPMNGKSNYNEICFEEDVKIKPIALVGLSDEIKYLAQKNKLKIHESINAHVIDSNHPIRHPISKFKELLALGIGSMFDGYQGLSQERECDFAN